jgi:hypothetical protein
MKKGLLSILAAAAILVSCQNYDDQFDNLNTQITALKTQVDGLAGVQSSVDQLKSLISSLQSATEGQDGELAALSTALTELAEDVGVVEGLVGDVATAEDLSQIESEVAGLNGEVDELLELNQIFTGNLTIKTEGQLDAALEYGNKVRIVNGNVDIKVSTTMNQDSVQKVVDRIRTITGNLDYVSDAATIAETTFNDIVGVGNIYVKQSGGIQFNSLGSALNITLDDAYESKVTNVDFGALESVSAFVTRSGTANATNTIELTAATNIDLGSLPRYTNATLTVKMKKGVTSVLDIAMLEDKDALGTQTDYSLNITGPNAVSLSKISDGDMTFEDINDVDITGFTGTYTINAGVINFTANEYTGGTFTAASDIESFIVKDSKKKTATATIPSFAFTSTHGDLTTLELNGATGAVSADGAGNLTTVTLKGTHASLLLNNLGDLTTVKTTGATIGDATITNNSDLLGLDLDYTSKAPTGSKGVDIIVTDNSDMTSLAISTDGVEKLTVQSNAKLEVLNVTSTNVGATGASATVKIGGVGKMNNLTAAKITDKYEASGVAADSKGGTIDDGTSKMSTLTAYLAKAKAAASTDGVKVYFDKADLHVQKNATGTADTETQNVVMASGTADKLVVMNVSQAVITGSTVRQKNTTVFPTLANGLNSQVQILGSGEGVRIVAGGVTANINQGTGVTTIDDLVTKINADTSFGADFTVTAAKDAHKSHKIRINYTDSGGSAETTTASGTLYYIYGTASGTINIGTGSGSADIASALASAMSNTSYNASASGSDITVYSAIGSTSPNSDLSNAAAALPTLSFVIDTAMTSTTAQLSANASNTAGLNSDFFLGQVASPQVGLRITVQNNSTSLDRSATITANSGGTALGTPVDLANNTNMAPSKSLVATFAEIENPVTVTAAATTDRTGWL